MLELAFWNRFQVYQTFTLENLPQTVINTVKFIKNYLNIHGIFVIDSQVVLLLLNFDSSKFEAYPQHSITDVCSCTHYRTAWLMYYFSSFEND